MLDSHYNTSHIHLCIHIPTCTNDDNWYTALLLPASKTRKQYLQQTHIKQCIAMTHFNLPNYEKERWNTLKKELENLWNNIAISDNFDCIQSFIERNLHINGVAEDEGEDEESVI